MPRFPLGPLGLNNTMLRWRLSRLPSAEIYARTLASYRLASARTGVSLRQAAGAIEAAEAQIITHEQHYYDLVVLEKDSSHITVRDRRGHVFTALDCVTNSYNDLEWFPENREALARFVHDKPLSACISRKIAGLHEVHDQLRNELADFLGYPAAVLGTNGYISQLSTLFALFHQGDVIFSDQHNHSSLADGCRLSHARVIPFPHRDYEALEALLKQHRHRYNGAGILSDGVFSTKGAVADVDRIVDLAERYACISVIDDTHGVGVLGRSGRGILDGCTRKPDVLTGGFGKALGSFGGFAVASRALCTAIDLLGRQNVNSSFLSPLVAAQALIHLRCFREKHEAIQDELFGKLRAFNAALSQHGLGCYPAPEKHLHPIFCLYRKSESETLLVQKHLIREGFLPSFFPPPVAPYPSLRFSLHRCLPESELVRLAGLLGAQPGLFVDSGGGPARQADSLFTGPNSGPEDTLSERWRARARAALRLPRSLARRFL